MTIHSEHPFLEPEPDRDPLRRFRGRLGGAVTLWTGSGGTSMAAPTPQRAGLTVSSLMVAGGEPGSVLGLLDPDSDLLAVITASGRAAVHLLSWRHRDLADAFAGVAPAPGGAFRLGTWHDGDWGPVLDGVTGWAGIRLEGDLTEVGWSVLVRGVVEHVEVAGGDTADEPPLLHRRGRYQRPPGD